jgi:branched-chain amino acid transport system permease protein
MNSYVIVAGLALGAIYALTAMVYNTMYSTSKVLSFGAGQFAMVGGIACAWMMLSLRQPLWEALIFVIAVGGLFGLLTEIIAVRRVIDDSASHLWVLTTLALATIVEQGVGLVWGWEPTPFPRLFAQAKGTLLDQKFWFPVAIAVAASLMLELFYKRTMLGKSFLAVAEDEFAARARGVSSTTVRVLSFMLAGVIGALSGLAAGQLTFADASLGARLGLGGFLALAVGGIGSSMGCLVGGLFAGLLNSFTTDLFGAQYQNAVSLTVLSLMLVIRPQGLFGVRHTRAV